MANDRELINKLFKIAEKQQKIIEKLAQQVAAKPTVEDFDALLQSMKTKKEETAKVVSAEALSDGSYDVRIEGLFESQRAFQQKAAEKWTGGDTSKIRVTRGGNFSGKPGWVK